MATSPNEKGVLSSPVDISMKQDAVHQEFIKVDPDGNDNLDYSGAHKKLDPEEIRLVAKLDRWIMVRLFILSTIAFSLCKLLITYSQRSGACTG